MTDASGLSGAVPGAAASARPWAGRRGVLRAGLAAVVVVAACVAGVRAGAQPEGVPGGGLRIVGTTGMVADAARAVSAGRATVEVLMGEGVDPHLFKPTRADIARLTAADVVFYNGLLLEGKLTDALVRVASSGRRVVAVTERMDASHLLEPPEFQGHADPHVWMDPRSWSGAVEVVRDALIGVDPGGERVYRAQAEAYLAELRRLDAYAERVLGTVPAKSRVLVTAHDAFNYLGRRYGYEVVGIQGISTDSEAGVRDIERLVTLLVEREVASVFVETSVAERNIRALVAGAGARGRTVTVGGSLYSDAMGRPGTYEGTYIGMIDHNVTTIARALGGDAPAGGMDGRLGGVPAPSGGR